MSAVVNVSCLATAWSPASGAPTALWCGAQAFVPAAALLSPSDGLFWAYVGASAALVLLGGVMSGLTIGLVALDPNSVRVLAKSGAPHEQRQAARVLPLIRRHHLLLVTLLLANSICMEALPIVLDAIATPVAAVAISVTAVLMFGEIIPQALCTRYGIAIGAALAYFVWGLIALLGIVAWPLSKLLDRMFGDSHSVYYRRNELSELIEMHRNDTDDNEEPLTRDEVKMIRGALQLASKTVADQMRPNASVLMVSCDAHVDGALLGELVAYGYSRVPVYQGIRTRVVGVLLLKTLVGHVALLHGAPACVRDLPLQPAIVLSPDTPLWDALHRFLAERANLAVVQDRTAADADAVGIITLEDILTDLVRIHDVLVDPLLPRVVVTGAAPTPTATPPVFSHRPTLQSTVSIELVPSGMPPRAVAKRTQTGSPRSPAPPIMGMSPSGNLGLVPTAVIRFKRSNLSPVISTEFDASLAAGASGTPHAPATAARGPHGLSPAAVRSTRNYEAKAINVVNEATLNATNHSIAAATAAETTQEPTSARLVMDDTGSMAAATNEAAADEGGTDDRHANEALDGEGSGKTRTGTPTAARSMSTPLPLPSSSDTGAGVLAGDGVVPTLRARGQTL